MPKTIHVEDRNGLLKPSEVAEILGVDQNVLADWRYRGQGPRYLKLGHRTVRYRPDELERWLAAREVTVR